MENKFLAKTYKKETIIEHTRKLVDNFYLLKKIYPKIDVNWELLYLACLYHDLGKMNSKFQNKIMNKLNEEIGEKRFEDIKSEIEDIEEIPHGYISPAFLNIEKLKEKFSNEEIRILKEIIYYHHNREKLNENRMRDLIKVVEKDVKKYINDFEFYDIGKIEKLDTSYIIEMQTRILNSDKYKKNEEICKNLIILKGLLNKIDFAASSETKVEIEPSDMCMLVKKSLEQYNGFNKLQLYMEENNDKNLIITASTGIGKTEGALAWIGKEKGFFTLPLKVSINAIYDRIIDEKKIGCKKEKVALLHSDTASEYLKRDLKNELDESYLNHTKQLSMPITVCTVDQLISFIFKYEGFELKQATLSYSKIVIDEIQMYSSSLVAYLLIAIKEIVKVGGKFCIVTATFPPIFEYFLNMLGVKENKHYLKPKEPFLKEIDGSPMLRHKIKVYETELDIEKIIKDKRKKKLVIVNTIKKAQEIYDKLKEKNIKNVNLFHARFIKEDRSKKEKEIFEHGKLDNGFEGIWITTQVVEASIDIDFDVLFTELSDISGLLQRMGRAYRNRPLYTNEANIHVFVGNEDIFPSGVSKKGGIIDRTIFNESRKCILKYDNVELNEFEKMKMVEKVYSVESLKKSDYYKEIKNTISAFKNVEAYDLKKNEQKLRDISSVTVIPEQVYKNNEEEINLKIEKLQTLKNRSEKLKIKDDLIQKTVSISETSFKNIVKKGVVIKKEINKFEELYIIPCDYSIEKGVEFRKDLSEFNEEQFL